MSRKEYSITTSFPYVVLCGCLLVLQGAGLSSNALLFTDNPVLIVAATLAVLVFPGVLIYPLSSHMKRAYQEYGLSGAFTLIVASAFLVQFFLCIAVFVAELNIAHASLIFFIFNLLLFVMGLVSRAWKNLSPAKIRLDSSVADRAVFCLFLLTFSVLLYRLGTPVYDIGGELLLQLATVRKIFENQTLSVSNVFYAEAFVTTYVFPLWHFSVALIAKIAHTDPLIVFFRLRWIGGLFALSALYAIANIVLERHRHTGLLMNVIAALVFTSLYITDYSAITQTDMMNRGGYNLLSSPHTADIAMVILLPVMIFTALFFLKHGGKTMFAFSTALFTLVSVFHVREYFQMLLYAVPFGFVYFFMTKEIRSYLLLLVSLLLAGLFMYMIQHAYAEHLVHLGTELSRKKSILDELLHAARNNPLSFFYRSGFNGFADLNMSLSLLAFYLSPLLMLGMRSSTGSMSVLFSVLVCFVVTQTMVLKKLTLFFTYSEFFICTARLTMIFIYLILGYLIAGTVTGVSGKAEAFLKKHIENRIIVTWTSNMCGALSVIVIFSVLDIYVKDGRWLEAQLMNYLYPVTFLYMGVFIYALVKNRGDRRRSISMQHSSLPLASLSLLLAALFISPNLISIASDNKSQNHGLWEANTITGIPPEVISFVRENIPMGSVFSVDTASRTSIFLYANVYVDHFPPLICDNIRREDRAYQERFDKKRPVYGELSSLDDDMEYVKKNRIDYILWDPLTTPQTRERYKETGDFFEKIYEYKEYVIYKTAT